MTDKTPGKSSFHLSEDWWAVIAAGLLILLAAVGLLGPHGLPIKY